MNRNGMFWVLGKGWFGEGKHPTLCELSTTFSSSSIIGQDGLFIIILTEPSLMSSSIENIS